MNHTKIFMIFNPTSGSHKQKKIQNYINALKMRDVEVELHETRYSGHATEIAEDISRRAPAACLVAAGGDGTIAEVVNGMVGEGMKLAVYPIGTANVFALELGIPFDYKRNIDVLLHGKTQSVYPGEILKQGKTEKFIQMAGVGLDSDIVLNISTRLKRVGGKIAYIFQALSSVLFYDFKPITVYIDGQRHEAATVIISKGRFYAGRYALCTQSMQAEKKFSVILIQNRNALSFVALALKSLIGGGDISQYVDCIVGQDIHIRAPQDMPIQCDGDIRCRTPARIRVSASGIKIIVP
ncbi:MAG: YegS/Rv2252/BmrU family lipid kinase [Acetobacter sp.]